MSNVYNFLSDAINKILIYQKLNFSYVFLNFSKKFINILKVLKTNGYIDNFYLFFFKINLIIIKLKYYKKKPVIKFFKKSSKFSLKIYKKYKNLSNFMNGLGIIIITTSKGVMTCDEAKRLGVGGELICYVF
ncbi:uS8 family ribosomal protein [Candidatus Nasuia deltocephalinicola]|uniref:uS8 family ribosomal protein n=1 Tax=Candidatus Nasuia deltocephalincola TaxID=1160784 RepID=UPI00216B19C1|nr:30S ribosomal protein S8 [Candidatus Nasuia deltocephalinicola]